MIYLTQLIYVKEGQEELFNQYENRVIPILSKYNGKLLLRVRPSSEQYVETALGTPYEIHLVEFQDQQSSQNFANDTERQQYLHWKEESVEAIFGVQGVKAESINVTQQTDAIND